MRVGFIGLGNLGCRLANNLVVSNVETFIYDLTRFQKGQEFSKFRRTRIFRGQG